MFVKLTYRWFLFSIAFAICLICTLSSCKKKHEYIDLPVELKELAVFKKGSYWIFSRNVGSLHDSCYMLVDPESGYNHLGEQGVYTHYEYIIGYYHSSILEDFYISPNRNLMYTISDKTIDAFLYDVPVGEKIFLSSMTYELVNKYSDYQLKDTILSDVYHSSLRYVTNDGDSARFQFFIARYIGLVKLMKQIGQTDTTWSLERWRVIR